jgi:hypothetical protein
VTVSRSATSTQPARQLILGVPGGDGEMTWINNHTQQGMGKSPLLAVFLLKSRRRRVLMLTWTTATRSTSCSAPTSHRALKVRDRDVCLYRDGLAIVTSWSNAPISWPRCRDL